ncbi:hypothetical protein LINGRAHAP2_LOCUS14766, partial [Linum grandiflorum]
TFFSVDCNDNVSFNFPLRFQLRGGALEEWGPFQTFLGHLSISCILVARIRVVWLHYPSFLFSVGYLMAMLRRQTMPGVEDFPHNCIRKKEVSTKIKDFFVALFC